jgi:hypothetical protein
MELPTIVTEALGFAISERSTGAAHVAPVTSAKSTGRVPLATGVKLEYTSRAPLIITSPS